MMRCPRVLFLLQQFPVCGSAIAPPAPSCRRLLVSSVPNACRPRRGPAGAYTVSSFKPMTHQQVGRCEALVCSGCLPAVALVASSRCLPACRSCLQPCLWNWLRTNSPGAPPPQNTSLTVHGIGREQGALLGPQLCRLAQVLVRPPQCRTRRHRTPAACGCEPGRPGVHAVAHACLCCGPRHAASDPACLPACCCGCFAWQQGRAAARTTCMQARRACLTSALLALPLAALHAGWARALITQNVDRLHQKAGSAPVLELHGTTHEVVCLDCGRLSCRCGCRFFWWCDAFLNLTPIALLQHQY